MMASISSKQKIFFIVNPFSGISQNKNLERQLQRHLDLGKFNYVVKYTQRPGHATQLASKAVEEAYDIVVAVGGDGSVNEVAQALIGSHVPLGILPAGSGNGFAMNQGIGRKIVPAILLLNDHQIKTIDSCSVNDRIFVNIAGLGFAAAIAYKIKNAKIRGFLSYLWTVLTNAWRFKSHHYEIWLDEQQIKGHFLAVEIANGAMYGYNFVLAAEALPDDQQLEVVLIRPAPKIFYFLSAWRFLAGSVHKSRLVKSFKAKRVSIKAESSDFLHLDGDGFQLSDTSLTFELNPLSLRVVVPK